MPKASKLKWISSDLGLPVPFKRVHVKNATLKRIEIAYVDLGGKWWGETSRWEFNMRDYKIVAWSDSVPAYEE